ncbi:MAG: VC0807 family protein [Opitutales bacterium]
MPAPPESSPSKASEPAPTQNAGPAKPENPWINLGFNLILPFVLFKQADDWFGLSPAHALLLALAFPVGYFIYDALARRKVNWISVLGVVSLLLTGGIGLLKLPTAWVPIKEAAVPLIIALVLLISLAIRRPLVRPMVMNRALMDVERVEGALEARGNQTRLNRLLTHATLWIVASFLFSAVLNYVLAAWIVTAESGTAEFNDQIGNLTLVSFGVIAIPSTAILMFAIWRLAVGLHRLTGLPYEVIFPTLAEADKPKAKDA